MYLTMIDTHGKISVQKGVESVLINHVQKNGPITSLDQLANEWGFSPWWLRDCAKRAARKGLLKITRMEHLQGKPFKVEYIGPQ